MSIKPVKRLPFKTKIVLINQPRTLTKDKKWLYLYENNICELQIKTWIWKQSFCAVVKIWPQKKNQTFTEFEPMTCAIPVHCFTNWANKPTGSWSQRLWSVGLTVFLILKWSTVDIITIMILLFHLLFFLFNRILCSCHPHIKFISSFRRVISSIHWLSGHSLIFP